MNPEKFYITTPIYYPSDKLHIGHTYCTVATDAMARYKRLRGCEVMFLTGTDEHGQKIEDKAKEAGVTPQEFVDHIVDGENGIRDLWKLMNISNDRFIRTTDDYHMESVQKIFKKMYEKGDIYKGTYKANEKSSKSSALSMRTFFFLSCIVSVDLRKVLIPEIFRFSLFKKGLEKAFSVGILIKP